MKYFPLIWAALWRSPARTIFTFLSVVVAFTLFGTMIGLKASVGHLIEAARRDRVLVHTRFGGQLLLSQQDEIEHVPDVTRVGHWAYLGGYYQDRKNFVGAFMIDDGMTHIWTDFPITQKQYAEVQANRTGAIFSRSMAQRWHRKAGDTFPIQTMAVSRADGTKLWPLKVLAVVDDFPVLPAGFIIGNFKYFDEARVAADRSRVQSFQVLVTDAARATPVAHAIDKLFANSGTPTLSISERDSYQNNARLGVDIGFVTEAVAAAGLFMIAFLTSNSIAQSVRERIPEFATMKAMGFSGGGVMALVFAEAAVPCLLGVPIGLAIAKGLGVLIPYLLPPGMGIPMPYISGSVLGFAVFFAVFVAFISSAVPALRIQRLDIAKALARK